MAQGTRGCPDENTLIPKPTLTALPVPIQALGFLHHQGQAQNYQALDDLQQLFHDHGNALVAQEPTDGLEMRRPHEIAVGAVDVAVGDVEGLGNWNSDSQTGPPTRPVILLSQYYVPSLQIIFKEEKEK